MKYFWFRILIFIGLIFVSNNLICQTDNKKNERYGFYFGYVPSIILLDFSYINSNLSQNGISGFKNEFIIPNTLKFNFYSGLMKNLRIGFSLGSSSVSSENQFNFVNEQQKLINLTKSFEYDFSFWTFTFDYSYPIMKRSNISLEIDLGKGSADQIFYQKTGDEISYSDLWDNFKLNKSIDTYTNRIKNRFFLVSPGVSFEYSVSDFIALSFSTKYFLSLFNSSESENQIKITNVPSTLKINNLVFQFGILFGIFMD